MGDWAWMQTWTASTVTTTGRSDAVEFGVELQLDAVAEPAPLTDAELLVARVLGHRYGEGGCSCRWRGASFVSHARKMIQQAERELGDFDARS